MASSAASDEEIAICGLVASTDIGQIINFDEWTCDTGSQPTTDPCLNAWPGILCTSGFITSIDLNSVGMTGSISPNIGSLLTLQSLRLDENDMDGILPISLGCLSELTRLDVKENSFSGVFPSAVGSLLLLSTLQANANKLSGSIPESLGSLSNLVTLRLETNDLSGQVPASLCDIPALNILRFAGSSGLGCYAPCLDSVNLQDYGGLPHCVPTALPTPGPSARPTRVPTPAPTETPTVTVTAVPTETPTAAPTVAPSLPSDTAFPTPAPTITRPTSVPSGQPSGQPSGLPTRAPNTAPPPLLVSAAVLSTGRTAVDVEVEVDRESYVFCAIFPNGTEPASADAVLQQGRFTRTVNLVGNVSLSGLSPGSELAVYCMAVSVESATHTDLATVLQQGVSAATECCKEVTAVLGAVYQRVDGYQLAGLTLTLSHPPTDSLLLSVTTNESPAAVAFQPSEVAVYSSQTATASAITLSVDVLSLLVGNATVVVTMSGSSASEFSVVSAPLKLTVLSALDPTPAPAVTSVQWSDDAGSVLVTFDSPTDRGGANAAIVEFDCSLLLSFGGDGDSACQWQSDSQVAIFPSPEVMVGDVVVVVTGAIRARCLLASTVACGTWAAAVPNATAGVVLAPIHALQPVVVMSHPASLGSCGDLTLDLAASSGAGGRAWESLNFSVTTTPAVDTTALEEFLSSSFVMSPPSNISSNLLVAGTEYLFSATLCNFLQECGVGSAFVGVDTSALTPIVSILGGTSVSASAAEVLLVTARAHTVTCGGTPSTAGLTFAWSVWQFGSVELVDPLAQSTSPDPTRFQLPAHRLEAGSWYVVKVHVWYNDPSSSTVTDAFAGVFVSVPAGDLVAVIAGGVQQTVRQGVSVTLDGSGSFDQDVPRGAGGDLLSDVVSFSWSCTQLQPQYNTTCPFPVYGAPYDGSRAVVGSTSGGVVAAVGTVVRVTLKLSDGGRVGVSTTDLVIVEPAAPVVLLTVVEERVNPTTPLLVSGAVSTVGECVGLWNLSDASVDLGVTALTPAEVLVPAQVTAYPVHLILPANALGMQASYRFTLTCGDGAASVDVLTNGPPLYGAFEVDPGAGVGLSTIFTARAHSWFDADLPLMYLFEYQSLATGLSLVVQDKSEKSYTAAMLPVGQDLGSGFITPYKLLVFDLLNASTATVVNVTVTAGPVHTATELGSLMDAQFASAVGDLDATRQVVFLFGSTLNAVNCSGAPECSPLNREDCGPAGRSATCGECLPGFAGVGALGAGNSACVSTAALIDPDAIFVGRTCASDCAGRGSCALVDMNTNAAVAQCLTSDPSCDARCICDAGWSGDACTQRSSDLEVSAALRTALITNFTVLTQEEVPAPESVASWVAGARLLTHKRGELTAFSADLILGVSTRAVNVAVTVSASSADVSGVLSAADTAASVFAAANSGSSSGDSGGSKMRAVLDGLGSLLLDQFVLGQAAAAHTLPATRFIAQVGALDSNGGVQVTLPQSVLETTMLVPPTTATLYPGTVAADGSIVSLFSLSASLAESRAYQFGAEGTNFTSNPTSVVLKAGGVDVTVNITFQNIRSTTYMLHDGADLVNTTCVANVSSAQTLLCPGNVSVTHVCNGTAGTLVTPCPLVHSFPRCRQLAGTAGALGCSVVNFTEAMTTCSCAVEGSARRRRLSVGTATSVSADIESFQAVTVVESIVGDVVTTYATIPTGEKGILRVIRGSVIVIALFGSFWFVGLAMMVYFLYGGKWSVVAWALLFGKSNRVGTDDSVGSGKAQVASNTASGSASDALNSSLERLRSYVHMLMPAVYALDTPLVERIKLEMLRSHHFLRLFAPVQSDADRRSHVLNSFHVLTTETMFLFLIAVCYDIDSPSDDGSCEAHSSSSACLERRSLSDGDKSYCSWDDAAHECAFSVPSFSWGTTAIISITVAAMATLMDMPVGFLFDVLASPTTTVTNEVKNVVVGGARRASMAAVRVSKAVRGSPKLASIVPDTATGSAAAATADIDSTYMLADDVVQCRRLLVDPAGGIGTGTKSGGATVGTNQGCVTQYILNCDYAQRLSSARESMLLSRVRDPALTPSQFAKEHVDQPIDASPGMTRLLVDMMLHAEKLISGDEARDSDCDCDANSNLQRCLSFMRAWNFAVVVPSEHLLVESGASNSESSDHSEEPVLAHRRRLLVEATAEYSLNYCANMDVLSRGLADAKERGASRAETLQFAGEAVVGMAIMHEFVLDVLGRDTSYGKIFARKAESDFQKVYVVSKASQVCAGLGVLLLNLFCIIYAVLKGYSRGVGWQRQFLFACVLQLFAEILIFETLAVFWNDIVVPQFAVDEVNLAINTVLVTINKFGDDSRTKASDGGGGGEVDVFNSASHLFVSVQLAKSFPSTLESKIVARYETTNPPQALFEQLHSIEHRASSGESGGSGTRALGGWGNTAGYVGRAALLSVVRLSADTPRSMQSLALSLVQPLLLGAVTYFVYLCMQNPVLFISLIGMVAAVTLAAYFAVQHVSSGQRRRIKKVDSVVFARSTVAPMLPSPSVAPAKVKVMADPKKNDLLLKMVSSNRAIIKGAGASQKADGSASAVSADV